MTATSPAGTRSPARRGSPRSLVTALRRTAKDWLDRPMTSWHLITGIFVLLLGFGLLMVLSASSITSIKKGQSPFSAFENQATFALLGLVAFVFTSRLSTRVMRTYSLPLVAFCVLLLAAVLEIGSKKYGARSWIDFHGFTFQPSEVAKLALLIWMGHVLAARRSTLRSIRSLLIPVLPVFLLMVVLIMKEPDLGTTVTLGLIFIAVLWFGGAPLWMFALLTGAAAAAMTFLATSAGYRNARILTWLHPGQATSDAVLQINQSLYGLGHGGLFGVGLGQAMSKAGWLPNADSDFIFAVIGEELGLVGAGLLVVLYGLLAYTGLRIARRNVDPFIKIVASSATVWLVGQAAINIGYVVGLLPVTGLTLPMISRGGTSLVITMVVFGMLANFARREPQAAAALHSQGPGRVASFLGLGPRPPKPAKVRKPPKPAKVRAAKPRAAATRSGSARPATGRPATGGAATDRTAGGRTAAGRTALDGAMNGREATGRPAKGRPAKTRSGVSRRPEPRPSGERPLVTGAGSGRGRSAADRGRRPDRPVRDDRTGRDQAPSRRDQRRDDTPRPGRAAGQQPPRLRRSGDAGPDGETFDWTGRAFVEPRRPRPDGPQIDDPRGYRPRPDAAGVVRPAGSGGRSGGRGRTVRP